MTRNALIVLVGITLCVCSPFWSSEAASLPASQSIFAHWMSNKDVCSNKQLFSNSEYVKICDKAKYPSNDVTLAVNNPLEILCLGVYDRIMRLCELDSKAGIGNVKLPDNAVALDKQADTLLATKDDSDIYSFCKSWKNMYPPRYEKIKLYVSQLDEATKTPVGCIKMCTDTENNFIPLCSVLAAMDNISLQIGNTADVPAKKPMPETTQKDNIAEISEKTGSVGATVVHNNVKEAPEKMEVKTESVKTVPSTTQKDVVPNSSEAVALPDAKPQESQPKVQKPVEESPKPELPSVSQQEVTPQKENAKKIEEPATAEQTPESAPVDSSKAKNVDPQPLAPEKPPIDGHVDPADMEDRSEVEKGPENAGQGPDDQSGEISVHTQDRANEDAGEEMNEMDPPMPMKDEVEESPEMPPEKQEFRPRMTSLRNDDESHVFGYFTVIGVICIAGYVGYHNKQKILAMVLEGRRSRGGRGRRRPSTANYRKLDCTLEEAVTSQCNSNVTHVIY